MTREKSNWGLLRAPVLGDIEALESALSVWEGSINRLCEHEGYYAGYLPELLNVSDNDCLMFVEVFAIETTNKWKHQADEYIAIYLKREGGEWKNICWPMAPKDCAPNFPESWNWDEVLDQVRNWNTVTYTTKLNDNHEQVEATWEVEE